MARQNLLLVDGDTRSRRVLEVSLRKAGFSVTTAENLDQALLVLEHGEPDLIISDTRLQPERDGFQFCQEVKRNPKWSMIPFVFLTSAKAIEDKVRGLELGVEDYLVKPIYIKEVTTRLRMLVQRKQRERLEKKDTARTKFTGHLADMAVVDLFQTIEISRKSGTIQFETELGEATIWFRDGSIIDAEMGRLQAEQAVYRLLGLNDGSFAVEFKPINRNAVIKESTQGLLMEGMRRVDEWGRLLEQLPPLDAVLGVDRAALADMPDGLLSPEVQGVLRRFDGRRTILGVVDETGRDDLEALEAISSLFFQGLLTASNDEVEEESVELGDSNPALRLEAWETPTATPGEVFQPPTSTPESGPHALPEEVPPMPSFPLSDGMSSDSGGLVAGLPDETPSIGDGLMPLEDLRDPRADSRSTMRIAEPNPGDDDGNPAFSQLGRTLKAIIDAEDTDDALALTELTETHPSPSRDWSETTQPGGHWSETTQPDPSGRDGREVTATWARAEQEQAARARVQGELERRDAASAGETVEAAASSPVESLRRIEEARERSRSLTEPMFVAPRPAPVVVSDEDDDSSASQSGGSRPEMAASESNASLVSTAGESKSDLITELDASEYEEELETKLVVGGAKAESPGTRAEPATPPPPPIRGMGEARRLAAPAPRTEPTWTRPPTLAQLGLDASKRRAAGADSPTEPSEVESTPKPESSRVQAAANQAPTTGAKDSSSQSATAGSIDRGRASQVEGGGTDDFAPLTVKIAEPARESLPHRDESGADTSLVRGRVPDPSSPELDRIARNPDLDSPAPSPISPPELGSEKPADTPSDDDSVEVDEPDEGDAPQASSSMAGETSDGGPKLGLWVVLVVVASVVGLVVFRDAIFGDGGNRDATATSSRPAEPREPREPEPTPSTSSNPVIDDGTETGPEPVATETGPDELRPTETDTGTEPSSETSETSETGGTHETGTDETGGFDLEIELASARRYFTKFRRTDDAKQIIDTILAVDPDHGPTLILQAQVLAEDGELADALVAAERAKKSNPDDPEVYPILAALYEAQPDARAAIDAYERYLELDPAGKYARVAKLAIRRLEKTLDP